MASIRWARHPDSVSVTLKDLVVGTQYKLQLLFADALATNNRGFIILVNSFPLPRALDLAKEQGGAGNKQQGVVVTHQFEALSSTVTVTLKGETPPSFTDNNPLLNGLTLEELPLEVTLNPDAVKITEGFGYGSTIAGLGGAIDTTLEGTSNLLFVNPLGLAVAGKFTVEAWHYSKPGLNQGVIWNVGSSALFRVNGTGLRMVNLGVADVPIPNVLNADAWNHLAMTFDGLRTQLFVNGVNVQIVA